MASIVKNMIVRVGADFSQLFGEIKTANKKVRSEVDSIAKSASGANIGKQLSEAASSASKELDAVKKQIQQMEGYSQRLELALHNALKDPTKGEGSLEYKSLEKEWAAISEKINQLEGKAVILKVRAETEGASSELAQVSDSTKRLRKEAEKADKPVGKIGQNLRSAVSSGTHASKSIDDVWRSIKRVGIVAGGLRLGSAIIGEFRSVVTEYIRNNEDLTAKAQALKYAMGEALAPAIDLVTTALERAMPYVLGFTTAFSNLIRSVLGDEWDKQAAKINGAASATKAATNAQKAYNESLAGFDRITKLGSENTSSASVPKEEIKPAFESFSEIDWKKVTQGLSEEIKKAFDTAQILSVKIDTKKLAEDIGDALGGIDWGGIKKSWATSQGGGLGTVTEFLGNTALELFDPDSNVSELLKGLDALMHPERGASFLFSEEYWSGFAESFDGSELVAKAGETGQKMLGKLQEQFDSHKLEMKAYLEDGSIEWWNNATKWWAEKAIEGTKFAVKLKNDSAEWWANTKKWWAEKADECCKFTAKLKNDSAEWWANTKKWWASKVDESCKFTAKLKNDSSEWWRNTKNWWSEKVKHGSLSVSAKIKLLKDGWKSLQDFIGSITKSIKITVDWKTTGLNYLEQAISNYLFRGNGFPRGLKFAAKGGIVNAATLFGDTVVGEAGQEALVPLERNTQWADIVSTQIATNLQRLLPQRQGSAQPININLLLDGRVVGQAAVQYINGQAVATGINPLSAYI